MISYLSEQGKKLIFSELKGTKNPLGNKDDIKKILNYIFFFIFQLECFSVFKISKKCIFWQA